MKKIIHCEIYCEYIYIHWNHLESIVVRPWRPSLLLIRRAGIILPICLAGRGADNTCWVTERSLQQPSKAPENVRSPLEK